MGLSHDIRGVQLFRMRKTNILLIVFVWLDMNKCYAYRIIA